jgi:hypothetical protein
MKEVKIQILGDKLWIILPPRIITFLPADSYDIVRNSLFLRHG